MLSLTLVSPIAYALPSGGTVSAGSAQIAASQGRVDVTQGSARAVIDWSSFNIDAGESVNFTQPDAAAIALNRVNSASSSQIHGNLNANGQVWLVNPHGVFFGQGATVNVSGLLATTADITNQNFMNGDFRFTIAGSPQAEIINAGHITVAQSGLAALVAPVVKNSGVIEAQLGRVQLGAGSTYTLDPYGDGLISLAASPAVERQLVENTGVISAQGGQILISAAQVADTVSSLINLDGLVESSDIAVQGDVVSLTGHITGDSIYMEARNIAQQGFVSAQYMLKYRFGGAYIDSEGSTTLGRQIHLDGSGSADSRIFASGSYDATGSIGGDITFEAARFVKLYGARVNASGANGGGKVRIGGDWQGQGTMRHAREVVVNGASHLKADGNAGNGGTIAVWSDESTRFDGHASATSNSLMGGMIEVSSKESLTLHPLATTDASSVLGTDGIVLLDPKNITISTSGLANALSYFEMVDPNADTGAFGNSAPITLASGNVAIADISDDFSAADAGALYLFNGTTGALISTLLGSTTGDFTSNSLVALTNGNFVSANTSWDNGGTANVGAVTWCSGTTGCSGAISATNSLIGSTASDGIGANATVALTNGNYVTWSTTWDNGGTANVGAVTWCDGTTGCTGAVSTSNSLYGATASDQVGSSVVALTNGNFVVLSQNWDNGGTANVGAITWCSGSVGCTGAVTTANSLYGTTASDAVGSGGGTALTNGNYVVRSTAWDNGGTTNIGAVTWCDGSVGCTGAVTTANSLYGVTANDNAGSGLMALTNGNYVVSTSSWDNGGTANAGAVTWCDGSVGCSGAISTTNSLYGTTASDSVGQSTLVALTNGNYVVPVSTWDNGGTVNVGAVVWCDGSVGCTGAVSTANSLYGTTASDSVGSVFALANGNYVVRSTSWDNGGTVDVGAVTWGDGSVGTTGAVSIANSLIGSTASDQVGSAGIATLTNGNYVVQSTNWDNGGTANVGAATWCDGSVGCTGAVSTANSLYGATASDSVGTGAAALTNGNYVIRSPNWDNGGTANTGAVTWCDGSVGCTGAVTTANSLYGTTASDVIGTSVTALANGNYIVTSTSWDDGATANAGAVTVCTGTAGCTGAVSRGNSLAGSAGSSLNSTVTADTVNSRTVVRFTASQRVYSISNTPLAPGDYNYIYDPSADYVLHPAFLTAVLDTGSNVTLQASNDITVSSAITVSNGSGSGGTLTLQAGRSILLNANITTDDGSLNLYAADRFAIPAYRDAGAPVITMAGGTSINAGTGAVNIDLDSGGDISLRDITAGTILVHNASTAGDIVLNGTLTASASGDALILASARNFINNTGSGALSTPAGRFLIFSTLAADNTLGGLSFDFERIGCAYGRCLVTSAGDGLLYSFGAAQAFDVLHQALYEGLPQNFSAMPDVRVQSPSINLMGLYADAASPPPVRPQKGMGGPFIELEEERPKAKPKKKKR